MEWVEITGSSVAEATERALDRLGVDESEAEIEVLEAEKSSLFGLRRTDARIRARIRPTQPRPKRDRRRNQRKERGRGEKAAAAPAEARRDGGERPSGSRGKRPGGRGRDRDEGSSRPTQAEPTVPADVPPLRPAAEVPAPASTTDPQKESTVSDVDDVMTLDEQVDRAEAFLGGLLAACDVEADLNRREIDEDNTEIGIEGEQLGFLVGPRGSTLQALQELTKTVLQRSTGPGGAHGRVRVDVGGYRERRRVALESFVRTQADAVLESGVARALEPMNSADRKVVHDTVNDIDGVVTISEGSDPRRWVVISPAE